MANTADNFLQDVIRNLPKLKTPCKTRDTGDFLQPLFRNPQSHSFFFGLLPFPASSSLFSHFLNISAFAPSAFLALCLVISPPMCAVFSH